MKPNEPTTAERPARLGRPKRPKRLPMPSVMDGLDDTFSKAYPALRRPRLPKKKGGG